MEKNFSALHKQPDYSLRKEQSNLALRIPAQIFSYIFHPLFIPAIATWYLAFIQAGYFTGIPYGEKIYILIRVVYNTIFFPAFTIILLKALGFIDSIFLRTQRERIIPYIATNIFYFWMYLVFRNQPDVPLILTAFIFGIFLSASLALMANIYFKISMHALGAGAFLGLLLVVIFSFSSYGVFLPAMLVILLAGFVGTSRLIVSNHRPFDIYAGICIGTLSQLVAYAFIA